MSKKSVVLMAMLVVCGAMGVKSALANTSSPVPATPWTNTSSPVPATPWSNTSSPVPATPWKTNSPIQSPLK